MINKNSLVYERKTYTLLQLTLNSLKITAAKSLGFSLGGVLLWDNLWGDCGGEMNV